MENKVFRQYSSAKLDDFEIHSVGATLARDEIAAYIAATDEKRTRGKGIVVTGPPGVGKTMLMCIVLNAVAAKGYRIEAIELPNWIDLHRRVMDLMTLVKAGDDEMIEAWKQHDRRLRWISGAMKKSADWVLFDDVGKEHESFSGWSNAKFHDVLRTRYNRGLPTLLTSNMGIEKWAKRYDDSLASFLYETSMVLTIDDEDHRPTPPQPEMFPWSAAS